MHGIDSSEFLKYHTLVSTISIKWKEKINQMDINSKTLLEEIKRIKRPTKFLYKTFLKTYNNTQQNKAETK